MSEPDNGGLDLFLSYAHRDNEPIDEEEGWVTGFERHLEARLGQVLGREPEMSLPAGWIVSEKALSFQVAHIRDGDRGPEPFVIEVFRLLSDGTLMIDVPLLHTLVVEQVPKRTWRFEASIAHSVLPGSPIRRAAT